MKRLDAAKLERLGRLVCGPLWQSELARTNGGQPADGPPGELEPSEDDDTTSYIMRMEVDPK